MSVFRWQPFAIALTVLLPACAGNPQPQDARSGGDRVALVEVTNNNWSDMVIYVLRDGTRFRLGRVPSFTTVELELPPALLGLGGDFQLAADPVGSERAFQTGPIHVLPGQMVEFTVQNHLSISHYSIWDI